MSVYIVASVVFSIAVAVNFVVIIIIIYINNIIVIITFRIQEMSRGFPFDLDKKAPVFPKLLTNQVFFQSKCLTGINTT